LEALPFSTETIKRIVNSISEEHVESRFHTLHGAMMPNPKQCG
jgi:hypothetical protein